MQQRLPLAATLIVLTAFVGIAGLLGPYGQVIPRNIHAEPYVVPTGLEPELRDSLYEALETGEGKVEGFIEKSHGGRTERVSCTGNEYLCAWLIEWSKVPSGSFVRGDQRMVDKPAGASYAVQIKGFEQNCPTDSFMSTSRTHVFLEGLEIVDPSTLDFFTDLHSANPFTGCTLITGGNYTSRY